MKDPRRGDVRTPHHSHGKNCHDSFYHDGSNETTGSLLSVKQTTDLCADATQLGHQRTFHVNALMCHSTPSTNGHHSTPTTTRRHSTPTTTRRHSTPTTTRRQPPPVVANRSELSHQFMRRIARVNNIRSLCYKRSHHVSIRIFPF